MLVPYRASPFLRCGRELGTSLNDCLRYRACKDLPTFFIADSLDLVREHAGAAIAELRHGAV
jgi:hypothetical protein